MFFILMPDNLSNPFEAVLALTWRCNLNCPFCYERRWRHDGIAELSPEQWLSVLRELDRMRVLEVRFSGGEPLFSPAFEPLVREIPRTGMRFGVISNGTLIDERISELLARSGRCDTVQLSLDGVEALHDRWRGQGNFRRTAAAIRFLTDRGIRVKINSVVMKSSLAALPELLELLESLPVASYRLNPLAGDRPLGEALTLNDLADLAAALLPLGDKLSKISSGSFPFSLHKWMLKPEMDDDAGGRCFRSHIQLNIRPDGGVTPCPDIPSPVCGNVLHQPVDRIWRGPDLEDFRMKCRRDTTLPFPECGDCRWRAKCRRHCPLFVPAGMCVKKLYPLLLERGVKI